MIRFRLFKLAIYLAMGAALYFMGCRQDLPQPAAMENTQPAASPDKVPPADYSMSLNAFIWQFITTPEAANVRYSGKSLDLQQVKVGSLEEVRQGGETTGWVLQGLSNQQDTVGRADFYFDRYDQLRDLQLGQTVRIHADYWQLAEYPRLNHSQLLAGDENTVPVNTPTN